MGPVPNPFDSAAVAEHLAARAAKETETGQPTPPPAPAPSVEMDSAPAAPPAVAVEVDGLAEDVELTTAQEVSLMVDRWGARGVHAFLEAMTLVAAAVEDMGAGLANAMDSGTEVDVDALYLAAQMGKSLESAGKVAYSAARNGLWAHLGSQPGQMTTPEGHKFKMLANTPISRSIKYAEFKKAYPEVYAATVTEKATDPSKAGRLYLS